MIKFIAPVLLIFSVIATGSLRAQNATDSPLQPDYMIYLPNLPMDSVATSDDITSLYFNPAGLGYHPIQVGYFYGHNPEDSLDDHTLFLNLFGIAFSTQWRNGPDDSWARRYTFGTGLINTEVFSLGTSYAWFDSNDPVLADYGQFDVGGMLRPFRFISFGAVARGLNNPEFRGESLKTRWDLGVAVRPLPSAPEALTLAVDTTWDIKENARELIPRYSIEAVPFSGLTLYGGWDNYTNIFFGLKFSQDITQLSFQSNIPSKRGAFYSGGLLVGQERFITDFEATGRYLEISLDTEFSEQKQEGFLFLPDNITHFEILKAIRTAQNDPQIRGILLTGRKFKGGWGQAEELRSELIQFAGQKPVYAYLESAGNKEYYIASVAEKIYMPPAATLEIPGLSIESYYLKDLFSKLGIQADFLHIGEYKTAPETFTRSEPSQYQKEQLTAYLSDMAAEFKRAVIEGRDNLDENTIEQLISRGIYTAEKARQKGLIDSVQYRDDVKKELSRNLTASINWNTSLKSYLKESFYEDYWGPRPVLAVVVLDGEVMSGSSRPTGILSDNTIGSESVAELLQRLRNDSSVKGVVLRINSPGGSSLASDIIWKEIRLLHEEKKFVTISLGNVAASGGYYLAVGGDDIVANRSTLTGSIGIFTGKFSLKGFYDMIGVNKSIFKTHPNAAIYSENDTFTEAEKVLIREQLGDFYELFLQRVRRSRQMPMNKIRKNAAGRIYSGKEARKSGMVDHNGGLMLAIELTRIKAGLDQRNLKIALYPNKGSALSMLGDPNRLALPGIVREAARLLSSSEKIRDEKVFFMLPYDITVR